MSEPDSAALVACNHDASYGNGDGTRTCILTGCGVVFTAPPPVPFDRQAALVARYRRDAKGETVHRADCKSLRGRGSRWDFADGMTADQIVQTLASARWLTACRVCRPDAQGESDV